MTTEETLWECFRYFVSMDESNAAVHCADVRYSPITFRLAEQLHDKGAYERVSEVNGNVLRRVMSHNGAYVEDKGR